MTKKEINTKITEIDNVSTQLRTELAKLEIEINDLKKQMEKQDKQGRFRPAVGEKYYFLSPIGEIYDARWSGGHYDTDYYSLGNIFKTKEDAEFACKKLRFLQKMRVFADRNGWVPDWGNLEEYKYHTAYMHDEKEIGVDHTAFYQEIGQIYFETESDVQQFIDENHDDILKYCFGVGE